MNKENKRRLWCRLCRRTWLYCRTWLWRRTWRTNLAAHMVSALVAIHISIFTFFSCTIEPPLHFPDEGVDIDMMLPEVNLDLDVLWDYSLVIDEEHNEYYDSTYKWRDEWYY